MNESACLRNLFSKECEKGGVEKSAFSSKIKVTVIAYRLWLVDEVAGLSMGRVVQWSLLQLSPEAHPRENISSIGLFPSSMESAKSDKPRLTLAQTPFGCGSHTSSHNKCCVVHPSN